jgi:MerR family transcriptional regulator, thiopeptide resistance regulator
MTPPADRKYETSEFAVLAGVTPRTLRYYDRLGLLRPKRSRAGYRLYSERDLEALEEIVALKFIGVPLKEIAAIRRRATRSFAQVLHAQREALEAKRRALTRAIAAVTAAETLLRSGTAIDAELFRRIIEIMHMDTNHEKTIATYTAMLKAKASHLSSMSAQQRATLQQQWSTLLDDVKAALNEEPGSPKAQNLLDRWVSWLQALSGTSSSAQPALESDAFRTTPELEEELWARRTEWLPAGVAPDAGDVTANEALERVRERARAFGGSDVLEFIRRARAARDAAR